jgi:hypothetical protein
VQQKPTLPTSDSFTARRIFNQQNRGCKVTRLPTEVREDFSTLDFILKNARWAGAPSQEQALREYLRDRMWEAVRRLSVTADYLIEVLVEIIEIQEDALR